MTGTILKKLKMTTHDGLEILVRLYQDGTTTTQTFEKGEAKTKEVRIGRKVAGLTPDKWVAAVNRFNVYVEVA